MKNLMLTLVLATGAMAVASVSNPGPVANKVQMSAKAQAQQTVAVAGECCDDPLPTCPPICGPGK